VEHRKVVVFSDNCDERGVVLLVLVEGCEAD
jgi:hypothetical protein